jgi:hypothetical protein
MCLYYVYQTLNILFSVLNFEDIKVGNESTWVQDTHTNFLVIALILDFRVSRSYILQYYAIRNKFVSLFENAVLRSIKAFFQLHQQVDISFYYTEVTIVRLSQILASLKPF